MNSTRTKIASLAMALLFLLAGLSQAMGSISCSMPCCQEKSDPCHASKEPTTKKDSCCGEMKTSFAPGSGCGPERKDAMEFSTVSHGPTPPPEGLDLSIVVVPPVSSRHPISLLPAPAPPGKAPLYLRNAILLI